MSKSVAEWMAELAPLSAKERTEIAHRLLESLHGAKVDASTASARRYSSLNARERQINDDYEWCLHDLEIISKYHGQAVVAYRKRILGSGNNHTEAWRQAMQRAECPRSYEVAMVIVPDAPPLSH